MDMLTKLQPTLLMLRPGTRKTMIKKDFNRGIQILTMFNLNKMRLVMSVNC